MNENEVKNENVNPVVQLQPACDILEQNGGVRLLMDLPGIDAGNLNIGVKDRQLHVEADFPGLWQGRQVHFKRSFQLSEDISASGISAKIKNGVLELFLPKTESARVHKIAIERD